MMKKVLFVAAIGVAAVAAKADSIVSYTNNLSSSLTDWAKTISLQEFNPALGSLQSVDIVLSSSLSTTLTVTNIGTGTTSGHASTELQIFIGANDFGALASTGTNPTNDAAVLDFYSSPNFNFSSLAQNGTTTGTKSGSTTQDSI